MSTKLSTQLLFRISLLVIYILISAGFAGAQNDSTTIEASPDTNLIKSDSLISSLKNIIADTTLGISPNALESTVAYKAEDSIKIDMRTKKVFMYKKNEIKYQDITLTGGFVEIELTTNEIYATGIPDSIGDLTELPVFTLADDSFESESMRYNYKSKKGLVEKVMTEDAEGFLHGELVKKMPNDVTNVFEGSYTTCELDHPHFAFEFKKAKVIPENKIVTGPAYMVIEDVPTPLVIPFGLFPNKKGQRSGIVIPTWGESTNRGFYFENGGYYFGISDYLDFKIVGDIYTLGSWAVKPSVNYRKRYKYNGYFNLIYADNKLGEEGTESFSRTKTYGITWRHNQDPKARPRSKFSSNVNIKSSEQSKFNPVSSNEYLSNTFQSSISYSTNFADKYFLNLSLNHSQNTITHEVSLSLPTVSFNVNRFYPLRAKKVVGKLSWYENISVNYSMAADNRIDTYDSLLFDSDITKKMRNGMKHNISISSGSIKLLKYLVWSNSVNYTERWYSQQHVKNWLNDTIYEDDVPVFGYEGTDTIYGFNAVRDFNFSSSLSTTMYGMYTYTKGPVKAIRHVIKPSVGFSMRPDFGAPGWGYYRYYINEQGDRIKYSPYDDMIYGSAPDGRSGALTFRLSNNLEMKVKSRKDTITGMKKVVLIEDLSIGTGYDFARDSLNMNNLTISGRTTLFKQLRINYASSFNPYALDSNGRKINKFEWDVNKKLFRPENHSWRMGISWKISSETLGKNKNKDKNKKSLAEQPRESSAGTAQELADVNENIEGFVDWNVPWSLNLSYDFNYTLTYKYANGYWNYDITKDKKLIQTLSFSGDVNITSKWKFGFRSGYNFESKELTYTSIDVYRDLHCWEMRFNWIPYGFRQSWNFSINIKSSLLQDLKLDKKKDFRDY
ncbi:MAG TPA: putative LPS assembly protein LptD [Bacteroidales bacterium]|nr:putative LPS assembly protein LptD [Bacteroidales bacterium]HRX96893.1 putative LPS assembly protein LptD [Bacteroidales bacterium]